MAKKQVGVSLRKPPPAAEFEAESRAAGADSGEQRGGGSAERARGPAFDSFVTDGTGGVSAPVITAAVVAKEPLQEVVLTAHDGEKVREMTVYLPEDLARRLAMHCREKDRDASKVVAEAIAAHIEPAAKMQPTKAGAPAKKPMRIEIPWAKWQKQFDAWRARFFPTRAYR